MDKTFAGRLFSIRQEGDHTKFEFLRGHRNVKTPMTVSVPTDKLLVPVTEIEIDTAARPRIEACISDEGQGNIVKVKLDSHVNPPRTLFSSSSQPPRRENLARPFMAPPSAQIAAQL